MINVDDLLITILLALIGWIIVHRFNAQRDFINKKREIRLQFLSVFLQFYRNFFRIKWIFNFIVIFYNKNGLNQSILFK